MASQEAGKLWGGRFQDGISDIGVEISESISFDQKLFEYDIDGSIAHAQMLQAQGILKKETVGKITDGLEKIREEIRQGKMEYDPRLEDIHTHIEKRLIALIGEEGKALHTGRSRNDQVALDTHMFLKEAIINQKGELKELLQVIYDQAQKNQGAVWAGYTHTQIAQPVLLSHYIMAWFWKFHRDFELLDYALSEVDTSPLGCAAMAGANYPISREKTAETLGFSKIYQNSLDGVSTRDYQLIYHFFASRFFLHVSNFCEDTILYNTTEFSYVTLGDKVTTGSSIMPQKKNPDIAELLRGKTGRVLGNLNSLLTNLKGLPLTYNRDLQEDKVYLFDSVRQVSLGIGGLAEILRHTTYHPERVEKNLSRGFAQATDVADYLVATYEVPFREAHELTGSLVLYCEQNGKLLDELTAADYESVWKGNYAIPEGHLSLQACIDRKQGTGSTSSAEVKKQLERAREILAGL